MLDLILASPPATEPVTLAVAKLHCRIDSSDEDTLLAGLITAARALVEEQTGRALVTQTFELRIDHWPALLFLPRPPAVAVERITYTGDTGETATLSPAAYALRTGVQPAYLRFDSNQRPPVTLADDAAICARYTAGYGSADDVPAPLRQAILLLVGHFYTNREALGPTNRGALPFAVDALLAPYRVYWFGEWTR
jgi:uncharacterized phiE125 gp8 family phage protein